MGVGHAEELADDADDGVGAAEDSGDESWLAGLRPGGGKDQEEQESFEGGGVELGGVSRGEGWFDEGDDVGVVLVDAIDGVVSPVQRGLAEVGSASHEGGEHGCIEFGIDCPVQEFLGEAGGEDEVGRALAAVEFAVDVVGESSEEDAWGSGEGDEVEEVEDWGVVSSGEEPCGDDGAEHPAMGGHSASVDGEWSPEGGLGIEVDEE